ncbi:MAG: efflux RND transporter periplasmic adaptor subunit [Planctomycetes bacterium]|nr:efflux RND transporter periplasmic adaptor subunit [Planctomycetota bacterium]
MNKNIPLWLVTIGLFVLLPAEAARAHEGHAALPTTGATVQGDRLMLSPSAAKAIGLATAKVQLADLKRTVRATASVELPWFAQAFATTLLPGKIERVLVTPGETVVAGQVLALVESLELENLQLRALQASAELGLAERMLAQREKLVALGSAPERELLESRTHVRQRSAELAIFRQKLRAVGLTEDDFDRLLETAQPVRTIPVTSPINGIISGTDVRTGQIVEPTDHLYHIVDHSRLWLAGRILEADVGRVRTDMPVQVTFESLPEGVFASTIAHVDLKINPHDRTLSIHCLIDNPAGALKPGMFGRMQIQADRVEQAVVCPRGALIRDGGTTFVLVEQSPGNFMRRRIEVGSILNGQAEILDGLFPGDKVVTVGSHELAALFGRQPSPVAKGNAIATDQPGRHQAVVAQGRVELPTASKGFASASIQGRVARILVEHGQAVEQGELLAEIESLEFKTLQLDLLQARAQMQHTHAALERLVRISEQQIGAKKELWRFQTEYETLQHSVASLERKLALVGLSAEEIRRIQELDLTAAGSAERVSAILPVRSPIAGRIAQFELVPGQIVLPNEQLFEVHDLTSVWVQAFLFERDAANVHLGQSVKVGVISDPEFRAAGTVTRVSPVPSSANRVFSVWTELGNRDSRLREGMAARVSIDTYRSSVLAADRK